jgi:membrane associated rhomboid family serine protease
MKEGVEGIALLIVIVTTLVSYQGFKSPSFFDRYAFEVDPILIGKEYIRMLSSGFLHANWLHLIFNMATLFAFSYGVGSILGIRYFILLYGISLLAGNLLALYIHRQHGDYSAIGASGAVSGVLFSSVVLFPEAVISFPFLPFEMPSWVFGTGYMLISLYGIKTQAGNIGHEAHVGGAIAGILSTLCLEPAIFEMHPLIVAALLIPFLLFMGLLVRRPEILLIENYWGISRKRNSSRSDYDEKLMDDLLEKVSRTGLNSLSRKEKQKLEELSKTLK